MLDYNPLGSPATSPILPASAADAAFPAAAGSSGSAARDAAADTSGFAVLLLLLPLLL